MGSIFKPKIEMPPAPQIEMPDETNVPSAEDQAREAAEAEELRRRQSKRKGRRSTILTEPELEDEDPKLKKPLLGA
jgi:hypothetical protein